MNIKVDAATLEDLRLLDRATRPGRTLYIQDDDLLAEARRHQLADITFADAHLFTATEQLHRALH